ncbi:MAG: hypothetical protein M1812_003100 [Candelaria pacifica]|nr:MAG: hypothetical protein M1812_003100 [Candelaria pacifica]
MNTKTSSKPILRPKGPTYSPLWERALERYRAELKECDDYEGVLDVASVEELLSQVKALEPAKANNRTTMSTLNRLEPTLTHMNDFAAVVALCLGAETKTAALVWGSIRAILTLALPTGDMLRDVMDMLEELSMSLPRFRTYEETLPMKASLESSLVDVYSEMTCFCARTINFFRNLLRCRAWPNFDVDFKRTIKRLKCLSQEVDKEADNVRMQVDREKNIEILTLMQSLKENQVGDGVLPCYLIPYGLNERFYGRLEAMQRVVEALNPQENDSSQRSIALYGMGGVGKTQIALNFANANRAQFDAILWISADNTIKMTQSFLNVAQHLGLITDTREEQDSVAAMVKVKAWLASARCHWLLIFNNADNLEVLKQAWPGNSKGSVLITSRDSNAAFAPAAHGYHVQPFDDNIGSSALLSFTSQDQSSISNQNIAKEITNMLGGLPLALRQISGFIKQQKLTLEAFLSLYERNALKIHERRGGVTDYEHTISTVWELALAKLPQNAKTLQNLLAFLDPDHIEESILTINLTGADISDFSFLTDEMDLLDAKEKLLQAALIDRCSEDASLSVHRLVQAAVMARLATSERATYADVVVSMLEKGFPNTWRTDVGHQVSSWVDCEKRLPHVLFLVKQFKRYKLSASKPEAVAELILGCCWYLYERENYEKALELILSAIENLDQSTLAYASAVDLHGLLLLDNNNPAHALKEFGTALQVRESAARGDESLVASSFNNIGLAYTEINDLEQAIAYHQKAIDIRLRTKSDRIGNSYSNTSSTLLRMGLPNEAEEMLARCPSLKDFNDETFLKTGNPRFSGDMVLLSRIRLQQGRLDDAIRLSSKALTFRQNLLGNRLKTCDSLYQVASLLQQRDNTASAIMLLQECISISESLPEGMGYAARAKFKLGQVYACAGDIKSSENYKQGAKELRLELAGKGIGAVESEDSEEAYAQLVVWMLW